jgi:tRNA pseudouridine38-40 synthase
VALNKKGESGLPTDIKPERVAMAMNARLPRDISVLSAEYAEDDFHPRYDVRYKEYVYLIWNKRSRDPFLEGRSWHCPRPIGEEGLENMKKAAAMLVGRQDFASYMAADSKIKDSVRTVYEAEVTETDGLIRFRVSADGFLYNMVRIFTGTLMDVAYGRISPEEITEITEAKDRRRAGSTAPPDGLYLNRVVY